MTTVVARAAAVATAGVATMAVAAETAAGRAADLTADLVVAVVVGVDPNQGRDPQSRKRPARRASWAGMRHRRSERSSQKTRSADATACPSTAAGQRCSRRERREPGFLLGNAGDVRRGDVAAAPSGFEIRLPY